MNFQQTPIGAIDLFNDHGVCVKTAAENVIKSDPVNL